MIIDSGDCLCKFQPENKSNTFGVLKAIYELVIVAYNNISKGHVKFNSVANFGVLGPGYTKVCIDHVNFNSVANFGVLEPGYTKVCIDHVDFNSVTNFGVLGSGYNNICKGHVNFNSVTNFGVLGPGYTKVCIDHVDFNSVPNFGAEITSSRSRKLASWGPALPIFAEILVMIRKLLCYPVLVCSKVGFCLFRGQVIATPLNFASAGLKTPIFVTLLSFIISIMSCERNLHDLRKLWRC